MVRLMLRLRLLGPVCIVFREPGWDEVDGKGRGGVSLFLQAVGGNILATRGVDLGEVEGQGLDLLVCDGRVNDEDQGLVARWRDEQQ